MASKFNLAVVVFLVILLKALNIYATENVATFDDTGFLWLVNKENKLPQNYTPVDLVEYRNVRMRIAAKDAFVQMTKAMEQDNVYGLKLQSGYRSFTHQQKVFDQKKSELLAKGHSAHEAEGLAAKSVQPPGSSEHQLGLAIDVSIDGTLTQSFGETTEGKWLEKNCHNYGFIIRYPCNKTDITQIIYEPWHLRYVGSPHSTIMKNLELTLEEYLIYIKQVRSYIFWTNATEYYILSHYDNTLCALPALLESISSLSFAGNDYVVTMRKTYPVVSNLDTKKHEK